MATITRRTVLGRAVAAALALGAVNLDHLDAGAVGTKPPVKRDPDNEYYFKVICDQNGKNCKTCWYNKDRQLMYCE